MLLALERGLEYGGDPRILGTRRQWLVRDELRLQDDAQWLTDRLDLVVDRGDRTLGERHQPFAADPHTGTRGGAPHDVALERSGLQVENPLVLLEEAVANVERLVVDEQPHDLAVRD